MSSNANTTDTADTAAPTLAAERNRSLRTNEESNLSPRVLRNQTNGSRNGNLPADDDERKPAAGANIETGDNESANQLSSQFGSMQLGEDQRPPEEDSAQAAIDKQAREFVQGVQHVCIGLESNIAPGILPTDEAVMLSMTKGLLAKKEEFIAANKPCTVDIGYVLVAMATDQVGSSLPEILASNRAGPVPIADDVSFFTSGNPNRETYIMAARLIGVTRLTSYITGYTSGSFTGNDSLTFRRGASEPFEHVTTVKMPTQCLPLVQIPSSMIERYLPGNAGNLLVREHHASLQTLVDQFFNSSLPTPLPHLFQYSPVSLQYNAPAELAVPLDTFATPIPHATRSATADNCGICLDPLHNKDTVCLKACPHKFHSECIQQALEHNGTTVFKCPICRKLVREERVQMPSVTMMIQRCNKTHCGGHEHCGSIVIEYRLSDNISTATTYLPETEEGRALLKRLKYAFCHGLMFKVGTPDGQRIPPIFSTIPQKISPTGGDGFPDPMFFTECNQQLDQAHVPPADALQQ